MDADALGEVFGCLFESVNFLCHDAGLFFSMGDFSADEDGDILVQCGTVALIGFWKHNGFDAAIQILQHQDGHTFFVGFRDALMKVCDQSADANGCSVGDLFEATHGRCLVFFQKPGVLCQRVAGHVHAQQFAFSCQQLVFVPRTAFRDGLVVVSGLRGLFVQHAEQVALSRLAIFEYALGS